MNNNKKRVTKIAMATAVMATVIIPVIAIDNTTVSAAAEETTGKFDSSKVNLDLFTMSGKYLRLTTEGSKFKGDIHVPYLFDGKFVRSIGNMGNNYSKAIYFEAPDLITEIDASTFSNSTYENSVEFKNLERLGDYGFSGSNFSEIYFGDKLTYIGIRALKGTLASNFLDIPNVTQIGTDAFYRNHFSGVNTSGRYSIAITEDPRLSGYKPAVFREMYRDFRDYEIISSDDDDDTSFSVYRGVIYVKTTQPPGSVIKFQAKKDSVTVNYRNYVQPEKTTNDPLEFFYKINDSELASNINLDTLRNQELDYVLTANNELYIKPYDSSAEQFSVQTKDGNYKTLYLSDVTAHVAINREQVDSDAPLQESRILELQSGALSLNHEGLSEDHTVAITLGSTKTEENIPLSDKMIVTDARGTLEGWTLTVRAGRLTELPIDGQYAKETAHTLKEGTLLLTGSQVARTQNGDVDVLSSETAIDKDSAITVGSAMAKSGGGISEFGFKDGLTLIVDPSDIVVNNKSGVAKAKYTTTLNWTLTSGPTN